MYDFITIERRYACGGQQIATKLSQKLNYRLYDHNMVVETCERLDLPYNMIVGMDEQAPVNTLFNLPGEKYLPLEEKIFNTEVEIIQEAAKEPGAIFVGRCAGEVLKDKKCLREFITASKEFRRERAIKVEKIARENAEKTMQKFDQRREKYFTAHSSARWGVPENFNLVLNSELLGVDACVDILVTACESI